MRFRFGNVSPFSYRLAPAYELLFIATEMLIWRPIQDLHLCVTTLQVADLNYLSNRSCAEDEGVELSMDFSVPIFKIGAMPLGESSSIY